MVIYLVLAGLFFGLIFYTKGNMVKPVSGKVLDSYTGKPIVGATVQLDNDTRLAHTAGISNTVTINTDLDGGFSFEKATDNYTLSASANNYRSDSIQPKNFANVEVRLRPKILRGFVKDDQGRPIVRAAVTVGDKNVLTEADGSYLVDDAPEEGQLLVKAAGYKPASENFARTQNKDITLQPQINKGIYLRAATVADQAFFPNVLNLISSTELNTVVIDLKDSNGWTFYDSKNPLARPAPDSKGKISDLAGVVKTLKDRGIYCIARISVFQDASLTDVKPELALKSRSTGKLWADAARFNWANPYNQDVWNYNISLAQEAASSGFDEVQFAMVQFPQTGNLEDIDYGRASNAETRVQAIDGFLQQANVQLNKLGVFVSVEVLGQSVLENGDLGIGQDLTQMADLVDYVSPVLFPSYFGPNSFGHPNPATEPFDVINKSVTFARAKIAGKRAQLRPWLQDFSAENVNYGGAEVKAEIQGVDEANKATKSSGGWLLWNVDARYTITALQPRS